MKDLVLEFYKKLLEGATIEDLGELPFGDENNNNLEKGLRLLYDKVIEDGNETE
jgi:hypothetical protein